MRTIWKFPLKIADSQTIDVPDGAQFLCVQAQGDVPTAWFKVNTTNTSKQAWQVFIVGTGNPYPEEAANRAADYVGTVQTDGGSLVWHVWIVWPRV
jgi:hypothetical protein